MFFKRLVCRLAALTLIISASSTFAASAKPPKYNPEGDVKAGEALAGEKGCAGCHGSDGNSPAPNFPKIAGIGLKYSLKQLNDVQSGKRNIVEMTGILDGLSQDDLLNLAAFYSSQELEVAGAQALQVKVNAGIEVDGLELGAKVYRAGNLETGVPSCMGCHSPKGLGNKAAGYPRLGGQYAQYIEAQLRAFRAGERVNDGDSMIMRGVAKNMSDAEIKAVSNFISGLQ